MGQDEFVILLDEKNHDAAGAAESQPRQEGFVILLDTPGPETTAGDGLRLPAHSGVAEVVGFYQQLAELMEVESCIRLLADSVTQIDSAFVQLLVATQRKLNDRGGKLLLTDPSTAMLEVMRRLDIHRFFDSGDQSGGGGPIAKVS